MAPRTATLQMRRIMPAWPRNSAVSCIDRWVPATSACDDCNGSFPAVLTTAAVRQVNLNERTSAPGVPTPARQDCVTAAHLAFERRLRAPFLIPARCRRSRAGWRRPPANSPAGGWGDGATGTGGPELKSGYLAFHRARVLRRGGWPRPLAAIGDGDRGRALRIESQSKLTGFDARQCEVDHIRRVSSAVDGCRQPPIDRIEWAPTSLRGERMGDQGPAPPGGRAEPRYRKPQGSHVNGALTINDGPICRNYQSNKSIRAISAKPPRRSVQSPELRPKSRPSAVIRRCTFGDMRVS